jgi:hypothetical protein
MAEIMRQVKGSPEQREISREGARKWWRETTLTPEEISRKHSDTMTACHKRWRENGVKLYWTGKKFSEESRRKMSESHRGARHTQETRMKISLAKRGKKNAAWRGGRTVNSASYVYILKKNHPFANNKGYVFEHRLVVENMLGRYLEPKEHVHHCNKDKKDNRPENLMVFMSAKDHAAFEHGHHVPPERIVFDGRIA